MPARAPLRVSRKLHFPRSAFCFRNWRKKQFSAFLVREWTDILLHFLAINRDWSSYKVLGNPLELGQEEHSNASGRASQDCVHDCQCDNATVSILRYAALHMNWWQSKLNPKLTCDPPLKARKPKTRMNPPSPARGTEWPGIFTGFPFTNLGKLR